MRKYRHEWIADAFLERCQKVQSCSRRTLPLLGVRQDLVCGFDVFELFRGLLVAGVLVRVIEQRKFAVALLNLLLCGIALDVENLRAEKGV